MEVRSFAPRFLFASDSFKGTISSARFAQIMGEELERTIPGATSRASVIADGGEGTVDAVVTSCGGQCEEVVVQGPLGTDVEARIGVVGGAGAERVVIEAADACGLTLLASSERDPEKTSSYGAGQLIRAALDAGYRDISLGIGGSATNDGGMGCARALGVRFLDAKGCELEGTGADLARVASVDISGLDSRLATATLRVMCDVTNPLFGPAGATYTFGPQKGASAEQLERLDAGMQNYARVVAAALGADEAQTPGAGAAGGLGFALKVFAGAELVRGIDCVLDIIGFDEALRTTDICVTGEGHLDAQTAGGKVISGIAARCKAAEVSCVAVVGGADTQALGQAIPGLTTVIPCVGDICTPEEALTIEAAEQNLRLAGKRLFSLILLGAELGS